MADDLKAKPDLSKVVLIDYVNHKGARAIRRIVPEYLWWGVTTYHPEPGWLLHAFDIDKSAWRDFSWHGIMGPGDVRPEADKATAAKAGRCMKALEFHEHLLRAGQQQLARDFIDMGLMDEGMPPRQQ